jgi:hypothetical protein
MLKWIINNASQEIIDKARIILIKIFENLSKEIR